MKKQYFFILLFGLILLNSCETSVNSDSVGLESQQDSNKVSYHTVLAEDICQIDVPNYMVKMDDVHEDAIIQYGYIQPTDSLNPDLEDEIYVIVLADYKNDLAKALGDSIEISIEDFNNMCEQNLGNALTDFSVEHEAPIVNEDRGVRTIHNEFFGRLGEYLVYYQIGIYETESGYYQVLTWCMQQYMQKHKDEMLRMTSSFKEL